MSLSVTGGGRVPTTSSVKATAISWVGGTTSGRNRCALDRTVYARTIAASDAKPSTKRWVGTHRMDAVVRLCLRDLVRPLGSLRHPAADLEILRDGEIGEQPGVLGRVADAHARALVGRQIADLATLETDLPGAHREQPDDAVDRRRLARAVP